MTKGLRGGAELRPIKEKSLGVVSCVGRTREPMGKQYKTTYIFGAGASFHAGYPFVKTMGAQLLAWMRVPRDTVYFNFAESADFLEGRFGANIEDLFNGVQTEIAARHPGYSVFANVYRPCLIEAMRQWFADIHRHQPAQAYERFAAEIVMPGDRVITFNYDISLDSKLRQSGKWAIGDGYGFRVQGLPTGSTVKILKLHGSINWLAILFAGMRSGIIPAAGPLGSRPVFGTDDLVALGYFGLADPNFTRPSAAAQPLVLPTNHKQFYFDTNLGRQWKPFWTRMWRSAKRTLRSSERIVLCGYGMYPIDRRGRNLLLQGTLAGDIEVCCGGESPRIVQELRDHGRRVRQADQTYFEQWVSAQ
jgi:hypothetical protein